MTIPSFTHARDDQLVADMPRFANDERHSTACFVACLAEFDGRRLYLGLGFASIYTYCAEKLHLTEGAAYRRIESARAARRFPIVLEMLQDGRLSLATAALIGPKLTAQNVEELLTAAAGKSKRQVEVLLAACNPKPLVPPVIRKLSEPKAVQPVATPVPPEEAAGPAIDLRELTAPSALTPPARRPVVAPLSGSHYKLQVTISAAARERLSQIQNLMRHRMPSGDPAGIVERALEVLHAQLLKEKAAQVARPRAGKAATEAKGRYIPASVKREVWRRDQGRCAFVGSDGDVCRSEDGVEFHHLQPYAVGGQATAANIEMRCRAHNGFEWTRHLDQETAALTER